MKKDILLSVGGDKRISYAVSELSDRFLCYCLAMENAPCLSDNVIKISSLDELPKAPDVILLPYPSSRDGISVNAPLSDKKIMLSELSHYFEGCKKIYGGLLPSNIKELQNACDYGEYEPLVLYNAQATAEGALGLAIESTDTVIHGSRVIITGYGRIARMLANMLRSFTSDIEIYARSPAARAEAEIFGLSAKPFSGLSLKAADIVFNTVPSRVITSSMLSLAKQDCLIIDLASSPGGLDIKEAGKYNVRAIRALGLPGKTAPKSSGRFIADMILREEIFSDE